MSSPGMHVHTRAQTDEQVKNITPPVAHRTDGGGIEIPDRQTGRRAPVRCITFTARRGQRQISSFFSQQPQPPPMSSSSSADLSARSSQSFIATLLLGSVDVGRPVSGSWRQRRLIRLRRAPLDLHYCNAINSCRIQVCVQHPNS